MNLKRFIAVLLIAAGTLALVYRGFDYTRERHQAEIGPLKVAVEETERVVIPIWAGVAAIVIGAGLLLVRRKG